MNIIFHRNLFANMCACGCVLGEGWRIIFYLIRFTLVCTQINNHSRKKMQMNIKLLYSFKSFSNRCQHTCIIIDMISVYIPSCDFILSLNIVSYIHFHYLSSNLTTVKLNLFPYNYSNTSL